MPTSRRPEAAAVRKIPLPCAVGQADTIGEDDAAFPGFLVADLVI